MKKLILIISVVLFLGSIICSQALADPSLVAHWKLDGNAQDSAGSNHGIIYGATVTQDAKDGQALSLDGVDDYVKIYPFDIPSQELTVTFWMKSDDTSNAGTPFSYASASNSNMFIIFHYNKFYTYIAGSPSRMYTSATDGVWHHIAVTWRSSDGMLYSYKDGELTASNIHKQGTLLQQGGCLIIGQEQDSFGNRFDVRQAFKGIIDDIKVYNRVLTDADILDIYQGNDPQTSDPIPSIIGFQGTLKDSSGTVLDGTFTATFRIYDAETSGTPLWEETHAGLNIEEGLLDVELGSITELDLPFDKQYWLGVEIAQDGEMTPRFRLKSVPYAIKAKE